MEKLLKILSEIRPDVNFATEKGLIEEGILDSFDVVSIISALDDEYGVKIRVTELTPENFDSAENIMELVKKLQNQNL